MLFDQIDLLGFGDRGWGASLLWAALVTLILSVCGILIGFAIGTTMAAARLGGGFVLSAVADVYVTVFRGVPDLLTIYLLYFGGSLALTWVSNLFGGEGFVGLPAFAIGAAALGIISGAYQSEVIRGAYLALDRGQIEAARAYGMSRPLMLRRIVGPQMLRHAIPGLGNVWQLILKDSALVSVTGLVELMRQAQIGAGSTRQPFIFYIAAGLLYLIIAGTTGIAFRKAEAHSRRGVREA